MTTSELNAELHTLEGIAAAVLYEFHRAIGPLSHQAAPLAQRLRELRLQIREVQAKLATLSERL